MISTRKRNRQLFWIGAVGFGLSVAGSTLSLIMDVDEQVVAWIGIVGFTVFFPLALANYLALAGKPPYRFWD